MNKPYFYRNYWTSIGCLITANGSGDELINSVGETDEFFTPEEEGGERNPSNFVDDISKRDLV